MEQHECERTIYKQKRSEVIRGGGVYKKRGKGWAGTFPI